MPQFFIKDPAFEGEKAVIRGEDFHHLVNVRRISKGDIISIRDICGKGFKAQVTDLGSDEITLSVLEKSGVETGYIEISLYMCIVKGSGFESAIQKAVEAGVDRIIPVISERTVPHPMKRISEKHERWKRIALEASKQSMRRTITDVSFPLHFPEAVMETYSEIKLIAHPGADIKLRSYLSSIPEPVSAAILVGPEGGFSRSEIELACGKFWVPVSCGSNHLRAETAAVVLPALVIYHWS